MMGQAEFLVAVAVFALLLVAFALVWAAVRAVPGRLKPVLEQVMLGVVAAQRNEAETLRTALATTEGRLSGAIQAGTTDALERAFRQIGEATRNVAGATDALRQQAAEDAQKSAAMLEARLGAIQASVNEKLHEAVEQQMTASFARVLEQFAQVQQAMGEVQSAAAQIGDLKRIFSNVKTRGGWGEAQLGAMLEQVLPPGAFERNVALREGARERVDFALRMPSRALLWLPVDAKFPTEDYDRLLLAAEAADAEAERAARDGLASRVRLEARKIREKYICPPDTVDYAVMYLPSDGLFAEAARIPTLLDEVRSRDKVIVLGPTLLPALLQTIHLGHITLDLEKRAGEIGMLLGATKAEMTKMDDVLVKLEGNAKTMSNTISSARTRSRAVSRALRTVEMVEAGAAQKLLGIAEEADQLSE